MNCNLPIIGQGNNKFALEVLQRTFDKFKGTTDGLYVSSIC